MQLLSYPTAPLFASECSNTDALFVLWLKPTIVAFEFYFVLLLRQVRLHIMVSAGYGCNLFEQVDHTTSLNASTIVPYCRTARMKIKFSKLADFRFGAIRTLPSGNSLVAFSAARSYVIRRGSRYNDKDLFCVHHSTTGLVLHLRDEVPSHPIHNYRFVYRDSHYSAYRHRHFDWRK